MRSTRPSRRILCTLSMAASCVADPTEEPDAELGWRVGPAPTTNDCADPGWADTLRCQSLAAGGFAAQPQPNWNDAPTSVSELKEYTRVFLDPDDEVRCYDGTIPVIYVDPADPPSDKWVISMTGGGSCVPVEGAVAGVIDDATGCTDAYMHESGEMGTSNEPPMKNLNGSAGSSGGIHDPHPMRNPIFSTYNRVRIEKCSYDRYNGRATFPAVEGEVAGVPVTYDAYQQGWPIMVAALGELLPGLSYTTWSAGGGGPNDITAAAVTLPPLTDAETILFVGHSGAAHGLMHNIDALADGLAQGGVAADVRAVFDANFTGSGENEAAFATEPGGGGIPLGGHLFSGDYAGESIAGGVVAGTTFTYDLQSHYTDPSTGIVEQYDNWQAAFDTSCMDVHAPLGDEWICRDRHHVLMNHVSTPMFIREDFTDPNKEHTMSGTGHPVTWAAWHTDPALCGWHGSAPCPPLLDLDEHRDRLEAQSQAVIDHYTQMSEMGRADTSLGTDRPTVYLWMPDCTSHAGAFEDAPFFETEMSNSVSTYSMRTWLEGFMNVPRTNRKGWRIDGWDDGSGNTMSTACP